MVDVKPDFDSPWKEILDIYFKDFIHYCWPEKYSQIDWKKGYKMLDKELNRIARNAPVGNKVVDKLVEFYCLNGKETYVLLHLEVQGSSKQDFEERMFIYRYRLWDLHRKPIASLAILIDGNKHWRPGLYRDSFWDSHIEMRFPIIKLLDYRSRIDELENSTNPFAHVILAQLAALDNQEPEAKLTTKIRLTRRLYSLGWLKNDILNLYSFIDWVMALPSELELEYYKSIEDYEREELHMKYVTSAERIGMQRGMEKGMEKGMEEGMKKGESTLLLRQLRRKFRQIPTIYIDKIEAADPETLLKWGESILDAEAVEEVFKD